MTTASPTPATAGEAFADALAQAFTASVGTRQDILSATRALPHSAYTGQLNTATTSYVRSTVAMPGRARARATLHLGALSEAQWDEAAAALTEQPDVLAAVMSGRVHPAFLVAARTAGHPIVPSEVHFECSLHRPPAGQAAGELCEHTAVLAHALAARLRSQPSALLVVRGCSVGRLSAKVRTALTRNRRPGDTPAADHPAAAPTVTAVNPGAVRADDAFALWIAAGKHGGDTAAVFTPPGFDLPDPPAGVSPGLAGIVADAAERARELLRGIVVEELDPLTDAIRHLATPAGAPMLETVAARLGRKPADVRSLVLAYRYGGPAGVAVAAGPLPVDGEVLQRGAAAIIAAQPTVRGSLDLRQNKITNSGVGVQVRLGPDGRWYPFAAGADQSWHPVLGPSHDPVTAYRAARSVRRVGPRR
ncbi:hypothetical protein ACIQF6_28625 [Kitasatospora sp. NPDC092948]|uniref:hypothetical protein n=1 Tax=Kitasatospora sp. NPDC092948 TaxID=3364088 RepID=UPI0038243483